MTLTYQSVAIQFLGSSTPWTFKVGANANYNLNAQVATEMEKNDEGIMVPYNLRTDQQVPTFQFSPPREDSVSGAARLNRLISASASSGVYIWERLVSANAYAAVTTGFQGFGAVANDVNAIGSVLRNGIFVPLTRVAFAGFNATVNDQFGLGANAALALSDNLIGEQVSILIPYPVANAVRLGTKAPNFSATVTAVQNTRSGRRTIAQIFMSLAGINVQESGQLANGEPSQISVVDLSGSCTPDIRYFDVQPAC